MARNQVFVIVSYAQLLNALGIPADTELVCVSQRPGDMLDGNILLGVKHLSLPGHADGAAIEILSLAECTRRINGR